MSVTVDKQLELEAEKRRQIREKEEAYQEKIR